MHQRLEAIANAPRLQAEAWACFGPTPERVHPRHGTAQLSTVKLVLEMQIDAPLVDSTWSKVPVEKWTRTCQQNVPHSRKEPLFLMFLHSFNRGFSFTLSPICSSICSVMESLQQLFFLFVHYMANNMWTGLPTYFHVHLIWGCLSWSGLGLYCVTNGIQICFSVST